MRPRSRGASLLELLVTASVAGTLATLAVPSFGRLVQDQRRTTIVNELLASTMLARAEAARRGRSVVICGIDDANGNRQFDMGELRCGGRDWSAGWLVAAWDDLDEDGRVDAPELAPPLQTYVPEAPGVTVRAAGFGNAPGPAGTAALRPSDRLSSNGTVTVCDRRGSSEARALVLSGNGRARITDTGADGQPLACP